MPRHVEVSPPEEAVPPAPPITVAPATPAGSASAASGAASGTGLPATRPGAPAAVPDVVAALLSLVLPGVGQMLLGQVAKGAVLLIVAVFTVGLCGVLNVVAAIDAYLVAQRVKRGETIGDFTFF